MMGTTSVDSQLAFGDDYAYNQASFVEFYDLMVASLPPEFEVGLDVEVYAKELGRFANSVAVDLATGSGRVLEGIRRVEGCKRLVGVDHSEAMLQACRKRLGTDDARISLHCQSMQSLQLPEDLNGACDAVFISAGSFHHLTTRHEQLATLRSVRDLLKASKPSIALVSLLSAVECTEADAEHVTKVGRYERRLLEHSLENVSESIEEGEANFPACVAKSVYECKDSVSGYIEKQAWSLRTVSTEEFAALCAAAGLTVNSQHTKFAEIMNTPDSYQNSTVKFGEESRKFFLGRAS